MMYAYSCSGCVDVQIDFTMCSGLIFAAAMTLFFFGFACMIFYLVAGYSRVCIYVHVYSPQRMQKYTKSSRTQNVKKKPCVH